MYAKKNVYDVSKSVLPNFFLGGRLHTRSHNAKLVFVPHYYLGR